MAATTTAVPEAPQHIGALGRLIGAIVNPRSTFEDIARKPSWLLPLLLLVVLSLATTAIFGRRVGWRAFMEKQLAQNSRVQQLTPEQRETLIERQTKFAPIIGYAFGVIGFPVIALIVAGIFMGIFNGTSNAGLDFKTSFGVVTHSYMPYVIVSLLGILILYLRPPDQIDLQNLVASNAGSFLSTDAPKWLTSLGTSIDVFTFWVLALMAFAYSVVRPKKISFGKGLTWVVGIWVLYVIVKVAFTAAFS